MTSIKDHESQYRNKVRDIIGVEDIQKYREISILSTIIDSVIIYFLLIAVMVITISFDRIIGYWTLTLAPALAVIAGIAFNWINVQIHEASHFLLFSNRKWNDVYVNLVLGSWGMQDVESYRITHMNHHAHLHTKLDPDLDVYDNVRPVLRKLLEDILIISAITRYCSLKQYIKINKIKKLTPKYTIVAKMIAQLTVLTIFIYSCGLIGFIYFILIWLGGLLAIFPVLVRIRTVVQHLGCNGDYINGESRLYTSRTTESSFIEFLIIGARMDYHFEHHLFPNIPYSNLKKIHKRIKKLNFFKEDRLKYLNLRTTNYLRKFFELEKLRKIN